MSVITINHVTKSFGDVTVFKVFLTTVKSMCR